MLAALLALALAQEAADLPGRWYPVAYRSRSADEGLSAEDRDRIAQLEALGYLGGTEALPPASGVLRHDAAHTAPGLNLYSSGHRPEAVLMDAEGRVLHRWHATFSDAFPDRPDLLEHRSAHTWRRIALLPDGGLLGIHEGLGLVRLDRDSRVRWATLNRAHHDLEVLPNGHLLVLTRIAHPQPAGPPILEDFVAELDADGRELSRTSVLAALERSPFANLLGRDPDWETGDLLHTNSLQRLDGRAAAANPAFAEGRLLIGSRTQSFVAVLDLEQEAVVWATRGPWERQHDAEIGASGHLLLFDNRGLGAGRSRVLVLDPAGKAERVVRSWAGEPGQPLHSDVLGGVQELENGNLLITESTRGRAVEVDPRGRVVWEFVNPETAREQYVAAIFEMIRVPVEAASFLR